jgi:2-keto-4-pentenoate hydratase
MTDHELARLLLEARSGRPVPTGPAPDDAAQAYRVQALVMAELGAIGGWKVGAPGPDGPISCAPLPAQGLFEGTVILDSTAFTQREVESEICFRLATALPARAAPYTADDIDGAIASCHPGIEVLQSRYAEPEQVGPLALLADFIQTGAFVVGGPIDGWREVDFAALPVRQTITGGPDREATGNPAGDMRRLMLWLANVGAVWAGGLRAGQIVTCGSWTGKTACPAGSEACTSFQGLAPLRIRFSNG